ncbi:alpha-1,2-fucosyltransferase [Martelella mediterranea]|uniref:Glycosyl transferase family 11 n=1 Tax=Martelella mediterranea TaxID=293089 RepID=A0A4R3NYJ0_9HYPH|nr:alpha-1,2-fucosyltransferase [Martelella mediterranea]TCT45035.1 glycosyl transferase family 11 [Martelella mediterranea]
MTISQLMGGLGNQMFEYATGRALSLRLRQPLMLDITGFSRDPLRDYALGDFNIEAGLITDRKKRPPKFSAGLQQSIANAVLGAFGMPRRILEQSMAFDPAIPQLRGNVYLSGFWQCERYFSGYADTIRNDLSLKAPFTAERAAIARQMNAVNAVSVHIRCGDDPNDPASRALFGVCDADWFREAMRRMAERIENPTFFVFSDHPPFAREIIGEDYPIIFIDPNADGRDCEDMMLMSRCGSHILPNSTFSWWGAWLNPSPEKHVIAPARWFPEAQKLNGEHVVPESWERL